MVGLIPSDVLDEARIEAAAQFDSFVMWIREQGTDGHGDPLEASQKQLPARVVRMIEEFYDAQGRRNVSAMRIYIPFDTPITTKDSLILIGDDAKRAAPVLEIANIPTIGEPVMLRVRTGAAR
jgi:hypothetical protein